MKDSSSTLLKLTEGQRDFSNKLPKRSAVHILITECLSLLFPHFREDSVSLDKELALTEKTLRELSLPHEAFIESLPEIQSKLRVDAEALLAGDPAAKSLDEVIVAYPGFFAVAVYRLAHSLNLLGVEIVPRMMTEYAHERTGIDIHPGARIGSGFCIDHGTGVVIGETTIIHENVKIYQGVTLGGLSVFKDQLGKKRHPTIENGVVIYANATILGGETVIGENSVIGGNVWLTESVPANSRVYCNPNHTARIAKS